MLVGTFSVQRGWQGSPYFSIYEIRLSLKFENSVSGDPRGSERVARLAIFFSF